ncbi:hypothetical protein STCU_05345 [Strigomonas culicis]|uniref:Uncharacterized protein n=1 Tax=Strigomonas culicis TaxID=28005 RepID=S9UB42_9TRYP|nr:hypothetical protein STCU_05345 [Strigomonas culicis]|eukprot:EPY28012.1 hypothetical protein STCU_05345 [Strigomonas culicis]
MQADGDKERAVEIVEAIEVNGVRRCDVYFFLQSSSATLIACPTVHHALEGAAGLGGTPTAEWQQGLGDLDFVLFDASVDASTDRTGRQVDYSFLASRPTPPRRAGETHAQRAQALRQWMQECFQNVGGPSTADQLKSFSPSLAFEYDSYLKNIGEPQGRHVEVEVGKDTATLTIPLLLSHSVQVRQSLTDLATLYARYTHAPWQSHQNVTVADFDLCIVFSNAQRSLTVCAERLAVRVEDEAGSSSYVPFLHSCIDLRALPQYASKTQSGSSFMDYVPLLEGALYHNIREPLHFMSVVASVAAHFGDPIDMSASCYELGTGGGTPPLVKTATFCVVDHDTSCSFMINLHYYSGRDYPSVGIVSNQYLSPCGHALLRGKLRFPPKEAPPRDADGFFDANRLGEAIVHGALQCMSSLVGQL